MMTQNKEKSIAPAEASLRRPLGIYVHIPFCRRKCRYCDFVSFPAGPGDPDRQRTYLAALKQELATQADRFGGRYRVDTVYIGGGTPTVLDVDLISEVVGEIFRRFSIVGRDRLELTLEANPESVDALQCRRMRAGGFNRVSLGVQSLDSEMLRSLGRIHDASMAAESYHRIRETVTDNVGVDLMFGLPGQTIAIWEDTLDQVLEWKPAHLSFYSLQLEEGTSFYENYRTGAMDLPAWTVNREMYHRAVGKLKENGYEHYEVSSAALAGRRCRHNLKYWTSQDYLGLGLAAHSFLDGTRYENTAAWDSYTDGSFLEHIRSQDTAELMGDYLFTELRKITGFDLTDFSRRFGVDFREVFGETAEALVREGSLEYAGGTLRLTARGLDRTNLVLGNLLNRAGGIHGKQ